MKHALENLTVLILLIKRHQRLTEVHKQDVKCCKPKHLESGSLSCKVMGEVHRVHSRGNGQLHNVAQNYQVSPANTVRGGIG